MKYNISKNGAAFITGVESFKANSYQDEAGIWTIGFGTTKLNGFAVGPSMIINEPVAWALFYGSCLSIVKALENYVKVDLDQNQVDALASFIYNIGIASFVDSSLLAAINRKLLITQDLFTRWNKIHLDGKVVISKGLMSRRIKEYDLYMKEV